MTRHSRRIAIVTALMVCGCYADGPGALTAPTPVAAQRNVASTVKHSCGRSATLAHHPLIILDGVPLGVTARGTIDPVAAERALQSLNPNDIETINVMKTGAATAIYGSPARDGALIIQTKRGARTS